ncbi:MAG TPA: 3-phosphoshikimate 1-carboxyvinyltransferase [Aeromicrobium sp.]|nr:3-phosphoshikimate 1-carboxyvinyltransferase [Aeromicrobium sp.]
MDFQAPVPIGAVHGSVELPGSKSQTNRALVLAALAAGPSTVSRPLFARDTDLMMAALEALGAKIERGGRSVTVSPIQFADTASIDCGLAGTVMRFVPPIAALGHGKTEFDGDTRARERPMNTTIQSLRDLGVTIDDAGRGSLPFTVHGSGSIQGGQLTVDASTSSQFVSALLLVAPAFVDGLDLRHVGDALPSLPHVAMTITELRRRGVLVDVAEANWRVQPGPIAALDVQIEPDLSNAGAFVAAALATGGEVRIADWPTITDQAGDAWQELAVAFGGSVTRDGADLIFTGPAALSAVDLDLHDIGELTPVVAALAALADGNSRLRGIAHLRGHETDRLAALASQINGLGGQVDEVHDGLDIHPSALTGGRFATFDDHRMAHAGAILGLKTSGVVIENIGTTAKTYPQFADDWSRLIS